MEMKAALDITAEQRRTILALLDHFIPGATVWGYVSRVKGTASPNSDLDLVAFTPEQRSAVSDLRDAFDESNLPFIVSLHIWDEVPERFHQMIRKQYVVLERKAPRKR
jgi:uncharacterized protein